MTRRNFITNASMMAAALALNNCGLPTTASNDVRFKIGYQLYSIRELMKADPASTLVALKEMGYEHGEVYGYDHESDLIFGVTPAVLKQMFDDTGMEATSGHYNFAPLLEASDDDMRSYVDDCISCATTLESKYLVWPLLREHQRTLKHYKILAEKLNLIGEHLDGSGLQFAYHNHGYEFQDHDGQSGYDIIRTQTDPTRVKLQLDMYWLAYDPKRTPAELIAADPGRYTMWHIKDMHKLSRDYTELGNGSIDYKTYLPDTSKSGLEYFYLEQGGNYTIDSRTSAKVSARFFQENLRHLI